MNALQARRLLTFLVVLAVHMALISWLMTLPLAPAARASVASSVTPLQLLLLPQMRYPLVRSDVPFLQERRALRIIALAPPALDSTALDSPARVGAPGSGDHEPGVNWSAEARRAVQAFEIRRDHAPSNLISGSSLRDGWLSLRRHRVGEQYKLDNGDWIVWITANCYEVATWNEGVVVAPTQTFCVKETTAPSNGK